MKNLARSNPSSSYHSTLSKLSHNCGSQCSFCQGGVAVSSWNGVQSKGRMLLLWLVKTLPRLHTHTLQLFFKTRNCSALRHWQLGHTSKCGPPTFWNWPWRCTWHPQEPGVSSFLMEKRFKATEGQLHCLQIKCLMSLASALLTPQMLGWLPLKTASGFLIIGINVCIIIGGVFFNPYCFLVNTD